MSDGVGRVSDIVRRGAKSSQDGRQDEGGGDEGDVDGEEGDAGRQVAGVEQPRVGALHEGDAGVVAEGLGDLAVAGINGEDARGAVLEHAVGEATGGGADVEAKAAGQVDVPVVEGGFELESAAANVAKIGAEEADGSVVRHGVARLVGLLFVDEHAAGENEGLGPLAGGDEAAFYQKFVETGFHGRVFMAETSWTESCCRFCHATLHMLMSHPKRESERGVYRILCDDR